MPARNETFPWPSHYGHYDYFEGVVGRHGKVASLSPQGDGVYELVRSQGDTLRLFICECYAFGVAEYIETVDRLGPLNVVVINSAWCGYAPDAKRYCRDSGVGLFRIGELMSALHRNDLWQHLTKAEEEYFKKVGWL